jgi:hypothetical protein
MKKKIIAAFLIAGTAAGAFFLCRNTGHESMEEMLVLNEHQRESYLNIRGWDVESISSSTVKIPETFDGIYAEYAKTAEKNGFHLEKYKGKDVERCLYRVKNYGGNSEVTAELLMYDNRLVSAVLIENKPDGFIKGVNFLDGQN